MAKAPVLIVGDIDRGGVFAQLIGTMMLLDENEKSMVKGLIINKFRGDKSILDPGVVMLEERAKVPVIGVTPYMNIDIEDEDSLTERFTSKKEVDLIDIAVIRLPRISNFTDYNRLESLEGVSLRYVKSVAELKNPDMIIIPGTKNTMKDLLWMRQNGLEASILKAVDSGKVIFGICGGYQMLGETISDPDQVEEGGTMKGMCLLPIDTVFQKTKTRTRVRGSFCNLEGILKQLSNIDLEGYEIHMGVSKSQVGLSPMASITDFSDEKVKFDGAYSGNVYGTYIHGIFDSEQVTKQLILSLAKEKGIPMEQIMVTDYRKYKEMQYDILADTLRKHLDMNKIYKILEMGI